jgi:hypothetical protein
MIVTSKRCYLNIVTQYCDLNTLLNANYYIADVRTPNGLINFAEDSLKYDENGQLTVENQITIPHTMMAMGKYNIKYGNGELDPTPYIANVLVSIGEEYTDPVDRFIKHLNDTDTVLSTYNFLFKNQLQGNGLQILIFNDEDTVKNYVHIVCEYLAHIFGCDITFIDPQCRPEVKGKATYKGIEKSIAEKNIMDIRDCDLLISFNQAVTHTTDFSSCVNNLISFLSGFDFPQTVHLYELLFPNDPLPPDNYTAEHIKQIIIGRVSSDAPKNNFNNIILTEDFNKFLERYENEQSEEDIDDDYYE